MDPKVVIIKLKYEFKLDLLSGEDIHLIDAADLLIDFPIFSKQMYDLLRFPSGFFRSHHSYLKFKRYFITQVQKLVSLYGQKIRHTLRSNIGPNVPDAFSDVHRIVEFYRS